MDSVESTALWSRADRSVVQLLGQQRETGKDARPMRAYRAQQRPEPEQLSEPTPSDAPVSLELTGAAHALRAYATYEDSSAGGPLHVRIVDAETTETVREITVTDARTYRPG